MVCWETAIRRSTKLSAILFEYVLCIIMNKIHVRNFTAAVRSGMTPSRVEWLTSASGAEWKGVDIIHTPHSTLVTRWASAGRGCSRSLKEIPAREESFEAVILRVLRTCPPPSGVVEFAE